MSDKNNVLYGLGKYNIPTNRKTRRVIDIDSDDQNYFRNLTSGN